MKTLNARKAGRLAKINAEFRKSLRWPIFMAVLVGITIWMAALTDNKAR
jgi:hypothetical protein